MQSCKPILLCAVGYNTIQYFYITIVDRPLRKWYTNVCQPNSNSNCYLIVGILFWKLFAKKQCWLYHWHSQFYGLPSVSLSTWCSESDFSPNI